MLTRISDDMACNVVGLQWARFYEQWPDEFHMRGPWYPGQAPRKEADRFAQIIANGCRYQCPDKTVQTWQETGDPLMLA